MNNRFEIYRRFGHKFVAGWLKPEVLAILAVLDSAQRSKNISGSVAEIGVHHGRLFIGMNLLRDDNEFSIAIDVFGDQELNTDKSGRGNLAVFCKNVQRWSSLNAVAIHRGDSTKLQANELRELARGDIRLFSVDGGHTESTVFSDMRLAEATVAAGGIVIADDVFNEFWPGVSMGTLRYLGQGGKLVPFAIGFTKVFFSLPEYAEYYRSALHAHFDDRILVCVKTADWATHEVLVLARVVRDPTQLISRSKTARQIYHRIREWHRRRN